jgi:N6-L-threonylcarbamoyladenine synthase
MTAIPSPFYILAIESSCDDTAAAILNNDKLLANIVSSQSIHTKYGGVVPELASRAHQQNIVPVVNEALEMAKIRKGQLNAVAYTQGPGLMGSLLVGASFAKGLANGLGIPIIPIHHMEAHVLAHLINDGRKLPAFPYLCLTVSGGHTQIIQVNSPYDLTMLGQTQDDAAGEAFDKAARILQLPYPGGPSIDKLAKQGNPNRFVLPIPKAPAFDFSFSGLKTAFLYLVQNETKTDADFIQNNKADLAASLQFTIVKYLMQKFMLASKETGINRMAIAGGVSANSELRNELLKLENQGKEVFIPPFAYCTDNAAMIGITAYLRMINKNVEKPENKQLASARLPFGA